MNTAIGKIRIKLNMTRQRQDPYEEKPANNALSVAAWVSRLLLLFITATALITAGLIGYNWWLNWQPNATNVTVEGGDPNLNSAERIFLQTYLSSNAEALNNPVNLLGEDVLFTISLGENAGTN